MGKITGIVTVAFPYVKVYPKVETLIGIGPPNGIEYLEAKVGEIMEFDSIAQFREMEAAAAEHDGIILQQYRLGSSSLFNTAGMLRWAIHGYSFTKDRKKLLEIFAKGFVGPNQPPISVWKALLEGKMKWEQVTDEGSIVFPVL